MLKLAALLILLLLADAAPPPNQVQTALEAEINLLKSNIKIYQKQMKTLKMLRKEAKTEMLTMAALDSYIAIGYEAASLPPPSSSAVSVSTADPSTSLPPPINSNSKFDNFFIARSAVDVPGNFVTYAVLAFKTNSHGSRKQKRGKAQSEMSGLETARVQNVLVVSTSDKSLLFYDEDGSLIHKHDARHVVTSFAFDSSNDPILATAGRDGSVHFHNMTMWQNDAVIVGKRPRSVVIEGEFDENGRPKRFRPAPPRLKTKRGIALVVHFESAAEDLHEMDCKWLAVENTTACKSIGPKPLATSMLVYSPRGGAATVNRKIIVSDDSGSLRLYSRNGTLMAVKDLELSERSERALMKTSILAINPAKWLQT